ncbi:MAG TPA: type I-U CRISPR-associated helicase/endonuclease Cas3 [Phycisphaerae bacterium]|nr:type I-U CRISPR-associated helicase/endonuclease Cas3 [Phycisphaerae bacterium]
MHSQSNFSEDFRRLTGNEPFPWQRRLFDRFVRGEFPNSCNLPTGLGKTSVIAVWLLALAHQPMEVEPTKRVPRRLVYVVNRRTIVDQATREAERLREGIQKKELQDVYERLVTLAGISQEGDVPLAISTLRGQFADNGEWSSNPARAAIVVGTVDMIGSRLLFSGYGRGFRSRPLHAGFLGQDALLVHDEAHLEPAFQELLEAIREEQQRCKEFGAFHVLPLTATPRGQKDSFELEKEDYVNETIRRRLEARKTIALHAIEDEKTTADDVASLAIERANAHPGSAILVFVRKVEDVKRISSVLGKKFGDNQIEQLAGTLRGLERDKLVQTEVFKRYLPSANRALAQETAFLICTSAGEVGVDISADHLICDLTPFDSMAQRFGRVNRYGNGDAHIDVVHPEEFESEEYEARRQLTLALLKQLGGDGSPRALGALPIADRLAAFSPTPQILAATDILFDAWALTSICKRLSGIDSMPGRPPVADWLHGVAEWQPAETEVAWREEVQWITGQQLLEEYDPEELLDVYPLKPHEILKDKSYRVFDELKKMHERMKNTDANVWIADDRGVKVWKLRDLVEEDAGAIANRMVILPPLAGGLAGGMLDGKSSTANDIADEWFEGEVGMNQEPRRRRHREWDVDGPQDSRMRLARGIIDVKLGQEDSDGAEEVEEQERPSTWSSPGRYWHWYVLPRSLDDEGSRSASQPVHLKVHTGDVVREVTRIVGALGIARTVEGKALVAAAEWHDLGKDRPGWQRSIRNESYPQVVLAKSGNRRPPVELSRYRHEFGSMLDVLSPKCAKRWAQLGEEEKELVLHLIATHHGRARPHFPAEEASDPDRSSVQSAELALEVPRRFAHLQRKYGRWGLAHLESILRAADAWASASPSSSEKDASGVSA